MMADERSENEPIDSGILLRSVGFRRSPWIITRASFNNNETACRTISQEFGPVVSSDGRHGEFAGRRNAIVRKRLPNSARWLVWIFSGLLFCGCQRDEHPPSDQAASASPIKVIPAPSRTQLAEGCQYRIFFIGNSHCVNGDLFRVVGQLIEAGIPQTRAYCEPATGFGFLDMHWTDPSTQAALEEVDWTHVVLQAQKYSTSGKYEYSTKPASQFIEKIEQRSAVPIMFPEWRLKGNAGEAERVQSLHESIARGTRARVAPVGMAWDLVTEKLPELELYSADGNHASEIGVYVTACTLYATITERNPTGLPYIGNATIEDSQLRIIQQSCWAAIDQHPPRIPAEAAATTEAAQIELPD